MSATGKRKVAREVITFQRYTHKCIKGVWYIYDAHKKRKVGRSGWEAEADAKKAAQRYDREYVNRTGDGPEGLKELLVLRF